MEDCPTPVFPKLSLDSGMAPEILSGGLTVRNIRKHIRGMNFISAYDLCREVTSLALQEGREAETLALINSFDAAVQRLSINTGVISDYRIALLHIKTGILIYLNDLDNAATAAADCLTLLAKDVKRRDEAFLSVLAAHLYDIARLHIRMEKYRQAEREIEKSARIFERLARISPERYGSAHFLAVDMATKTHLSRVKQVKMLESLHAASDSYMKKVNAGVENAVSRLADSLEQEGRTLMQMGKEREAVHYFTRALKYLTKVEPDFTVHQLELSVALGEALLCVHATKEKGVHLLNTMLHKATRLQADDIHKQIVDILYHANNHQVDILGFWHKIFPR